MSTDSTTDLLTITEAADYLRGRYSAKYLAELTRKGIIPATQPRPGGKRFVTRADLDAFMARPADREGT